MAREAEAFTAIAVCTAENCGIDFEAVWPAEAIDSEDTDETPETELTCPGCGHRFRAEYPGWSEYQSA